MNDALNGFYTNERPEKQLTFVVEIEGYYSLFKQNESGNRPSVSYAKRMAIDFFDEWYVFKPDSFKVYYDESPMTRTLLIHVVCVGKSKIQTCWDEAHDYWIKSLDLCA